MGFYSRYVFPRFVDFTLSGEKLDRLRKEALAPASGRVLEIGFGTGLNLPHYPSAVTEVVGLEPNAGMVPLAARQLELARMPVRTEQAAAEALPFPDQYFDSVVSTLTLCSVQDAARALGEMRRVLRPDGRLVLLEHGLSDEPRVQKWQRRLNPINRIIGDGCQLDRDIVGMVEQAGFEFATLRRFYIEGEPKFASCMTLGDARLVQTA